MNAALKRLMFAGIFVVVALVFFELWAYDVIKIDFISFMEIQPSFDVQEDPLPVPKVSGFFLFLKFHHKFEWQLYFEN